MKSLTVFLLVTAIVAATTVSGQNSLTGDPTTVAPSDTTTVDPSETTTAATSETTTVAPGETTTAAPSETTAVSPGETTTVDPSETTTAATSETTTVAPGETTTVATGETTTAAPSETTAVSPGETTTAAPSETTTVDPSETTTAATSETTTAAPSDTTNAAPSETTAVSPGETTTAVSSETTNPGPSETTTDASSSTPGETSTAAPSNKLQCYTCEGDDCNEKTVINCPDDGRANDVENIHKSLSESAAEMLLHNYRSASRLTLADVKGYACYSVQIIDNDDKKMKLGCIAIPYGQSACEAVRQELNITDASDQCLACQTDLCNDSAITKLSVAALLTVLLVKFLF